MESDQLSVEENLQESLQENLDPSHQGESPEAIAVLASGAVNEVDEFIDESVDENIKIEPATTDKNLEQDQVLEGKDMQTEVLIAAASAELEPETQPQESLDTSEILTIINQLKQNYQV
jgi:hypothetical protein